MPNKIPLVKAASDGGLIMHPNHKNNTHVHHNHHQNTDYELHLQDSTFKHEDDKLSAVSKSSILMSEVDVFAKNQLRNYRQARSTALKKKDSNRLFSHLPQEDFAFHDSSIIYNIDIPYRAATNMQNLMGSTKVKLNDPRYSKLLQRKIRRKDEREFNHRHKRRMRAELNRVKQLIIDGAVSSEDILSEFQSTTNYNPTYRVNKLLKRLEEYDKFLTPRAVDQPRKIVPVEPYEYNGDKYFLHMHLSGETDWVPPNIRRQRFHSKNAMVSASTRKLLLKTMFKREETKLVAESKTEVLSETNFPGRSNGKDRVSIQSESPNPINTSMDSNGRRSISNQKMKKLLKDEMLADALEVRDKEVQEQQDEYFKAELQRKQKRISERWLKPTDFSVPLDRKRISTPSIIVKTSFDRLKKSYGIPGEIDIYQHTPYEKPIMLKFIEEAQDANELFGNSEALNKLYEREQVFVDQFVRKLHRKLSNS